ncbi:MAG: hypothetical protein QHH14_12240 [Clostridiales bacterium]|nr:hypothetical protein [Clostridiales bacterium]
MKRRQFVRFLSVGAACSTMDGPFAFISGDRVTILPDRQVSEFYDMTGGEEGSPRPGWIAPGFVLEEVDLVFTREAIAFMERCCSLMYKKADYETAVELMRGGQVQLKPLISCHFSLREYAAAYKYIESNREKNMKVLIDV